MANTFNTTHPELRKGEYFFNNLTIDQYKGLGISSKRRGNMAYDADGNVISRATALVDTVYPVFINIAEVVYVRGI